MAGRKTLAITDRQFEVLDILWNKGPLTVRQLMDELPRSNKLPYTTVLGLLQNMEKGGLVSHDREVLTHRYRPTMTRREATGNLLSDFARRFFKGSAARLVVGLVESDQLTAKELRELEERLRATEAHAADVSKSGKGKTKRGRS